MKYLFRCLALSVLMCMQLFALEKKPLKEVNIESFTLEICPLVSGAGDDHSATVWWMPSEYWEAMFLDDDGISEKERKEIKDAVDGVFVLAVSQADISGMGFFKYYSEKKVKENMAVEFIDKNGKKYILAPVDKISPELKYVINIVKSLLQDSEENLNFFVFKDTEKGSGRIVDPYEKGTIEIKLKRNDNVEMGCKIELPLDNLYIPRKCPNGMNAHVSWKFCPWTGKPLEK